MAWLTPVEAARYVRLSVSALAKYRTERRGPIFSRVSSGRGVRYSEANLDLWLRQRAVITAKPRHRPTMRSWSPGARAAMEVLEGDYTRRLLR